MNEQNLKNILIILGILILVFYFYKVYVKNVFVSILEGFQTLENLPDNIYEKTGNFSLKKFQKENNLATFKFAFDYVFIRLIKDSESFIKIFTKKEKVFDYLVRFLKATTFETKLNTFLNSTVDQLKNNGELFVFIETLEKHKYSDILNNFIDKDFLYKIKSTEIKF